MAAVRSTFAIVAEAADKVPGYFYGQLFARDPKLRELFPPAMNDQRDRLVKALVRIVESLTTPEEMAAYLAQLGRDHRKYRIEPEMYEVVGAALLATLRRFAGPAFTPAAEQAWTDAYAAVSALMIQAADEAGATAPAFWPAEVVDIEERFRGMAVLTIALDQGMRFEGRPARHRPAPALAAGVAVVLDRGLPARGRPGPAARQGHPGRLGQQRAGPLDLSR